MQCMFGSNFITYVNLSKYYFKKLFIIQCIFTMNIGLPNLKLSMLRLKYCFFSSCYSNICYNITCATDMAAINTGIAGTTAVLQQILQLFV